MKRPCLGPAPGAPCPTMSLTPGTRCPPCTRTRDRARGTTTARGYGTGHQRVRTYLEATLPTPCGYGCGTTLYPGGEWVAAHRVDGDPSQGYIAACSRCNQRARSRGVITFS